MFLTNHARSAKNITIAEPGLSDFYNIVNSIIKIYYEKQKARIFGKHHLKLT